MVQLGEIMMTRFSFKSFSVDLESSFCETCLLGLLDFNSLNLSVDRKLNNLFFFFKQNTKYSGVLASSI